MKINNAFSPANNIQNKPNTNATRTFTGACNAATKGKSFVVNFFEPLRKGDMSRNMFILTAFTFLLGSRMIASRDNNERRETLLRDLPTFVLAVKGVPFFQNIVANTFQKKSGFAILQNPKNYKDGLASPNQLSDWYKYNPQLESGFDGFTKRLSDQGGNLKKICSSLNENIKNNLQNFSADNDKFVGELAKDKNLQKTVELEFTKGTNKALQQASYLKSMPKIVGFIATLSLIGIFIPKLNIHVTREINKNKAKAQNIETNNSNPNKTTKNA